MSDQGDVRAAMSDARIAEIRARAEAATAGPWVPYDMGDDVFTSANKAGWWWVWQQSKAPYYGGVLEVDQKFDDMPGAIGQASITDAEDGHVEHADATFIAAARQDVPDLLAEVLRLRAERVTIADAIEAKGLEWHNDHQAAFMLAASMVRGDL